MGTNRQYTGQISEPQLGLYFYNARFYDPYLARFISPDSIIPQPGSPLAWDRYSYTGNNPINYVDPSGHALKLDDSDPNGSPCGINGLDCRIVIVGTISGSSLYPEPSTLAEKSEEGYIIESNAVTNGVDAVGLVLDGLIFIQNNILPALNSEKITVFAFYYMEEDYISIQSIDVMNPTNSDVSVIDVHISAKDRVEQGTQQLTAPNTYSLKPNPSIGLDDNFYGFPPCVRANSITTIDLVPSGFSGNTQNIFTKTAKITIGIRLVQTTTGRFYQKLSGEVR